MYETERAASPLLRHRVEYPNKSRKPSLVAAAVVALAFGGIAGSLLKMSRTMETPAPAPAFPTGGAFTADRTSSASAAAPITPLDHGALDRDVMAAAAAAVPTAATPAPHDEPVRQAPAVPQIESGQR